MKNTVTIRAIVLYLLLSYINPIFAQQNIPYFKTNGNYTLYNTEKKTIIENLEFNYISSFKKEIAIIEKNGKKGIINSDYNIILKPEYDVIGDIADGYIFVGKGDYSDKFRKLISGEGGYVDRTGQFKINLSSNILSGGVFKDGVSWVENQDGKFGIIDENGKIVVDFIYDYIDWCYNNQYQVSKNGKYGLINKEGNVLIPIKYDWFFPSKENLYSVSQNGKFGFVDSLNRIKIPLKFTFAYSFSNGLAPVSSNGKWGFINKQGATVIPFKYDDASSFVEGHASVKLQKKVGLIDTKGKLVVPFIYDHVYPVNKEYAIVDKLRNPNDPPGSFYDGLYGIVDLISGETILPLKLDMINFIENNIFELTYNSYKWFRDVKLKENYSNVSGFENIFRNYCPENFKEISTKEIIGTARKYKAKDGHYYYEVKLTINPNSLTKQNTKQLKGYRYRKYPEGLYKDLGMETDYKTLNSSSGTLTFTGCVENDIFRIEGIYSCETGRFKGPSANIYFRDLKIIQ